MLLSVIVPFYGVEAYLPACLKGLEPFPPEETEILLVDDCGRDGSCEIARRWQEGRENARVIRRAENGGLSVARNSGLAEARGDYVWFLDSDDVPLAEAAMRLTRHAAAERLDVAKARFRYLEDETGKETPGPAIPETEPVSGADLFAGECRAGLYEPMVWQCVYRRDFLSAHGLTMAEGMLFEDELFQTPALLAAERAAASREEILLYRQRGGSIMRGFSRSAAWCGHYLEICRRLSRLAEKTPGPAGGALSGRVAAIAVSLARNVPAYGLTGEVRREAMRFLRENRREIAGFAAAGGRRGEAALIGRAPELYTALYGAAHRLRATLRRG